MHTTFFLTTAGESDLLLQPRMCTIQRRLRGPNRDDYALVRMSPAAPGVVSGCEGRRWIISSRHQGYSLFAPGYPPPDWPIAIYLVAVRDNSELKNDEFTASDFVDCGKAEVFQSREEAEAFVRIWAPDRKG